MESGPTHLRTPAERKKDEKPTKGEQVKMVGGLLALYAGLIALLGVLALAIAIGIDKNQFTQLATAVIGIIASMIGAYFGIKIGTDTTAKVLEGPGLKGDQMKGRTNDR